MLFNVVKSNTGSRPDVWNNADIRREEYIMNFPVPIAFGEIIEFLTLANSRVKQLSITDLFGKTGPYDMAWNKVWINKINQLEAKSTISMANDPAMLQQVQSISAQAKATHEQNIKTSKIVAYSSIGGIALIIILLLIIIF